MTADPLPTDAAHPAYEDYDWSANWSRHEYLTPPIRDWFEQRYLQGRNCLRVLTTAAPLTTPTLLRTACDWGAQFHAGYVLPLRVVHCNIEPLFTVEGAREVNALNRCHRFTQTYQNHLAGVWDVQAEELVRQRSILDDAVEDVQWSHPELRLPPPTTVDPNSRSFLETLRSAPSQPVAGVDRPFEILLSGPNGRWVGRNLREAAGEVSFATEKRTRSGHQKRDLYAVSDDHGETCYTHGFAFGFHPVGPAGGRDDFVAHQGKDPSELILRSGRSEARVAVMGLGPTMLDDARLWEFSSPPTRFDVVGTAAGRTEEEHHRASLQFHWWYMRQFRACTTGNRQPGCLHLGHAIAKRIWALYQADQRGWSQRYLS